jgi:hypothetical protein
MDPAAFGASDPSVHDTGRFARLNPEARLRLLLELCDLTDAVQAGRPNAAALRAQQPRSPEAIALWERLMRGSGRGR